MKRVALFLTFVIMVNLLIPSVATAQQENDWKIIMYALDGRTVEVWASEADAYAQVGWYYAPMTRLYADGGKSCVVPTQSVSTYRAVGWRPLHDYIFETNFTQLQYHFGAFQCVYYHAGSPNSCDLPYYLYKKAAGNNGLVDEISVWNGYCDYFSLPLKNVFPYLALSADENGWVSLYAFQKAMSASGIYGAGFRMGDLYSDSNYSTPYGETVDGIYRYYMNYDERSLAIDTSRIGYVNINTSTCYVYSCYEV